MLGYAQDLISTFLGSSQDERLWPCKVLLMRDKYMSELHGPWAMGFSGLEREKPFNFLDNLKPFTWKNYLNKGNWLHLLSRGIIVWTELKPYIYTILWHSPEELETTNMSQSLLPFTHASIACWWKHIYASLSCSSLPNSSCNSVLRSQMSQTNHCNQWAESFMPEEGKYCHHWSTGEDHEDKNNLVLLNWGTGGYI